jgi:tetratricopeptide (TPR) repeat protein
MKFLLIPALSVLMLAAGSAWSAGGGGPDPTVDARRAPADPLIEAIQAAVAKADWPRARELARDAVAKNPSNADYHNLYAYSIRMGANPEMDLVFRHYNEALRIDPKHLAAHEYLGEAYLQTGNLAKAKEQLRTLDRLCFFSCKEYRMLKKAVDDYETTSKASFFGAPGGASPSTALTACTSTLGSKGLVM